MPLIVEAPHTFFDRGTLPVALAIFEAQRARALILNTSHRYGGRPNPRDASVDDEGADGGRADLGTAVGGGRNPGHTAEDDEGLEGAGGKDGGDGAVDGNTHAGRLPEHRRRRSWR